MLALMILFHLFGFLWLLQFVIACQHMVTVVFFSFFNGLLFAQNG
jgi:hypothetical protein